ncbi:hypothetical protein P7C70_g3309, partial [Phenoliferia sp. Uapishka_3]
MVVEEVKPKPKKAPAPKKVPAVKKSKEPKAAAEKKSKLKASTSHGDEQEEAQVATVSTSTTPIPELAPKIKPKPKTPKKPVSWEQGLKDWFAEYEDPESPGKIGGEGVEKLFGDMGVSMEGPLPFILAFKISAKPGTFGSYYLSDLEAAFREPKINSNAGLKMYLNAAEKSLFGTAGQSTPEYRAFYAFLLPFMKEEGQKSLEGETASALWSVILAPKYKIAQEFVEYTTVSPNVFPSKALFQSFRILKFLSAPYRALELASRAFRRMFGVNSLSVQKMPVAVAGFCAMGARASPHSALLGIPGGSLNEEYPPTSIGLEAGLRRQKACVVMAQRSHDLCFQKNIAMVSTLLNLETLLVQLQMAMCKLVYLTESECFADLIWSSIVDEIVPKHSRHLLRFAIGLFKDLLDSAPVDGDHESVIRLGLPLFIADAIICAYAQLPPLITTKDLSTYFSILAPNIPDLSTDVLRAILDQYLPSAEAESVVSHETLISSTTILACWLATLQREFANAATYRLTPSPLSSTAKDVYRLWSVK